MTTASAVGVRRATRSSARRGREVLAWSRASRLRRRVRPVSAMPRGVYRVARDQAGFGIRRTAGPHRANRRSNAPFRGAGVYDRAQVGRHRPRNHGSKPALRRSRGVSWRRGEPRDDGIDACLREHREGSTRCGDVRGVVRAIGGPRSIIRIPAGAPGMKQAQPAARRSGDVIIDAEPGSKYARARGASRGWDLLVGCGCRQATTAPQRPRDAGCATEGGDSARSVEAIAAQTEPARASHQIGSGGSGHFVR